MGQFVKDWYAQGPSLPSPVPTTPAPVETPYVGMLGDVNGNSKVDIVDALLTAKYYVGLNPSNFNKELANVNCDNTINIVDALLIARYYVGIINKFCS